MHAWGRTVYNESYPNQSVTGRAGGGHGTPKFKILHL